MPATATAQDAEVALTARGEAYCLWARAEAAERAAADLRATLAAHGATFPFTLRPTEDGFRVEADHTAEPGKLSNLSILGQMFGYLGFNLDWTRGGFDAVKCAPSKWSPPWATGQVPCPIEILRGKVTQAEWLAANGEAG